LLLLGLYAASRLVSLTILPVFADEAIYIRWSQMIFDDPKQFTFLPLYDGKTPLFIWLLIPLTNHYPTDPLWAARMLSVIAGLLLLYGIKLVVKECGGSQVTQLFSTLLVLFLPFTFFYSRMALIDTLLAAFLSFSYWSFLKSRNYDYQRSWLLLSGLCWGLALLTKTSAFYFLPVFGGTYFYDFMVHKKVRKINIGISFGLAFGMGLAIIAWMRVSPLFPFLFQRSSDFAHPLSEIMSQFGHIFVTNLLRISNWLFVYMTPAIWILLILSAVLNKYLVIGIKIKKTIGLLTIGFGLFIVPFIITGKLLSSRYFLPAVIWLIPITAFCLESWYRKTKIFFALISIGIVFFSLRFVWPLTYDPGKAPLAHEDVVQYLTDWSSGYGIPEIRDFLIHTAKDRRVIVATEGSFGTLPDGLYIYFHGSPLQANLEIHGIGQPVAGIPDDLLKRTAEGEVFLVVNQNRLTMDLNDPKLHLLNTYPRPSPGYPLLLLKINQPLVYE
jgi:4-amino-4-deoxy-L-arabinose transferase-like glycosyltransferase